MESPATGVVSVDGNTYASRLWLDKHSIAHRATHCQPVDGEDLESMAMQMHQMCCIGCAMAERLTSSISTRFPFVSMSGAIFG